MFDPRWTTRDDVVARLSALVVRDPAATGAVDLLRMLAPHHVDAALVGTLQRSRACSVEDLGHTLVLALARRTHASPAIVPAPLPRRLLWPVLFWSPAAALRDQLLSSGPPAIVD